MVREKAATQAYGWLRTSKTKAQLSEEALKIHLEDEDSLTDVIDTLITESLQDFPEVNLAFDPAARHAAEIARANITDCTCFRHI
ncbi:hypothetical protein H0H92_008018, partial [Tricholoma furcatifolium]